MNAHLYRTTLVHTRTRPKRHTFTYTYLMLAVDLDALSQLQQETALFGYNRLRPYSIHDRDYLIPGEGSLHDRLLRLVREKGEVVPEGGRIVLLTSPKFFRRGFNPVSFYYCYAPDDSLRWILAEVNNTFGERHFYFLHPEPGDTVENIACHNKLFHVSPFLDRAGTYRFTFSHLGGPLAIDIRLDQDGEPILSASMRGVALPATRRELLKNLLRFPFSRCMTMFRIYKQAAALHFKKGVGFFSKPIPCSEDTIVSRKPNWIERFARKILEWRLRRLQTGRLEIRYPDGNQKLFGDPVSTSKARIRVWDPRFFTRTLYGGDIGFGDSYVKGEWDSPDPVAVLQLLIANLDAMGRYEFPLASFVRRFHAWENHLRKNSLKGSRRNIADHYDLSDGLFRSFLDDSMTYSCALYTDEHQDLSSAQRAKLEKMLELASVEPQDKVLEIGSGWGSLAVAAAEGRGCQVTTTTISKNQFDHVRKTAQTKNLTEKLDVLFSDYRELNASGSYDKILSIEMLEAVGREYLGKFFEVCRNLLKPDGLLALQVITIPDRYFEAYARGSDWIQKNIFPGGFLPSLGTIEKESREHGGFSIREAVDIGPHYARTLRDWRERFVAEKERILGLGFSEEFFRKWIYYFCYCEAAFASRYLSVHQIALTPAPVKMNRGTLGR